MLFTNEVTTRIERQLKVEVDSSCLWEASIRVQGEERQVTAVFHYKPCRFDL